MTTELMTGVSMMRAHAPWMCGTWTEVTVRNVGCAGASIDTEEGRLHRDRHSSSDFFRVKRRQSAGGVWAVLCLMKLLMMTAKKKEDEAGVWRCWHGVGV